MSIRSNLYYCVTLLTFASLLKSYFVVHTFEPLVKTEEKFKLVLVVLVAVKTTVFSSSFVIVPNKYDDHNLFLVLVWDNVP